MDLELLFSDFWEKLGRVNQIRLRTKSYASGGRNWNGKGDVVVTRGGDTTWVFQEKGFWNVGRDQTMAFSNALRWTLDKKKGLISLEHLRQGPNAPVFLFYLAPVGKHLLASVDAHLCKEDIYVAQVSWDRSTICLRWRVTGLRKNEAMEYCYL